MALSAKFFSCSSSTNSTPRWNWKYHVFLSFRGEDTRHGFTDHLYSTLQRKGIVTFRDKEGLKRGGVISQELLKAIEESFFAVVILSENYASSSWCLDELKKILESKNRLGQEVLPVFYGVDPSHVRHQRGNFGKAFAEHKKNVKKGKKMVRSWRAALTEVAGIAGCNSSNCYETDLIEEIAKAVWTKLHPKLPSCIDGLVGIDSKVKEMKALLMMGLEDVRFVGIWGMGGIGKTTLARVVYEEIRSEFQIRCFLTNVREDSKHLGLVHLQRTLLSCLNLGNIEINDAYEGRRKIRHFLCNRKVLLVLDDISDKIQLMNLAEKQEWFGPGSRVIITTRDMHLLTPQELFNKYDIKMLTSDESLQLFCQKAFCKDQPEAGYLELSKDILTYSCGLPLALEVLGSFLCGRSVSEWQDALNRMNQNPGNDILNTLQISYEGLNMEDRAIFLDIACFHNYRMEENMLKKFLKACGHDATLGLNILVEKSLLSYERPYFCMHDLLNQLGRNIVLQESPNDANERSRIWSLKEIDQVLRENEGTKKIQSIVLMPPKPYQADWHEDCFTKMSGLKLLIVRHVHLSRGLKSLPSALKILNWEGYPSKALPDIVQLDELVDLVLRRSKLRQLWNSTQFLGKLKFLDLSHSKDLTRTPDFAGIPNLERLTLAGCVRLVKVHPSLGQHGKLVEVDFRGCENLTTLPSKFSMNSLENFILSGCLKLEKLPEFGENMESLSVLDLQETAIEKLHPSLGFLTSLSVLNLSGCKNLVCFPNTMCNLKSLRILNISLCSNFRRLPENLNENVHLEELHANGTAIREVPSCLVHLKNLKVLTFRCCKGTPSISSSLPLPLPRSFSGLSLLMELDLSYCDLCDESFPDDFSCLSSLRTLSLMGNDFVYLPVGCMSNLLKLQFLHLNNCTKLRSLPELPPNLSLVVAIDCDSLKPLLDQQQLFNLFAAHDFQNFDTQTFGGDFVSLTSGNEIPSWFHNQNYHFEDMRVHFNFDSAISITFDIPDYLHSSEWSGIAVCLVLEELMPEPLWLRSIEWFFQSLEYESTCDFKLCSVEECYDYPLLFVAFFPFNNFNCWRHLRDDLNRLKLTIFTRRRTLTEVPGIPLSPTEEDGKLGIKECGWRLLCKEDFEMWRKTMGECNASTSISTRTDIEIPFNGLNNRRRRVTEVSNDNQCRDEFEGQDPSQTSFDAEAPRSLFRTCSVLLILVSLLFYVLVPQ